eukprot:scaffold13117_cov126-Amphora_coffeaeformis.AAC.1
MKVPSLLLPSTVLVALADEIIFHGHVGIEWLPPMKVPSLLLPSTVLVALTKSYFTVMPAWNGCPRLPQMKVATLLLPSTVLVTLADKIIFHGNAGMEWLPSVAPNEGSVTTIAINSAFDIDKIIFHDNAGMEWLPSVAPNEGSVTAIAIYSSCGIGVTQSCTKILFALL